ncbi:MAG: metallopeptidase [Mogibacterium sp.]|nr:metallopeptidase [Mogibacterium sp.]
MTEVKGIRTKQTELEELAADVLEIARGRLLVNLRYMDVALTFHERKVYHGSISTDGRVLYYDPVFTLRTYLDSKEQLTRKYLHLVLHCVFCHPFIGHDADRRLWDLACDIASESVICELDLPCTRSDDDGRRRDMLRKIRRETGFLTAEKIYSALRKGELNSADTLENLERLFLSDEHSAWYSDDLQPPAVQAVMPGDPQPVHDEISTESEWKEIAEQIEMEIETFAKVRGKFASSLVQNLRAVNREKYDYSDFLRKFAAINETVRVSDDEFDYIYYNYGLQHYHKMPLIEPLEYREDSRIKDFVIAIDTSGSVAGEEVQTFLQKTYNILKSRESFHNKIKVHIIQCDAQIQSDEVITSAEDFDRYLETMEICGLGGTDFRPVFDYVDRLLKDGEFSDLKGLIYFTDGLGVYPSSKPAYRTAFVFVESGYNVPEVPVWAMKVVLRPDEL